MKKLHAFCLKILVFIVALYCIAGLCACKNEKKPPVEEISISITGETQVFFGDFDYADYTITVLKSDGTTYTLPLSALYLSEEDQQKLSALGVHTITVRYNGLTATFTLEILPKHFENILFEDKTVVYNGEEHILAVENLPSGANVAYSDDNGKINAGVYPITATITQSGYHPLQISATLTIEKATYDTSGVVFEDKTVTYDGSEHSIFASNLPEGVSVQYTGNGQSHTGCYEITAIFTGDTQNYHPIENKTATLTITPQSVGGISFDGGSYIYDGTAKYLAITGDLPDGVSVSYENNGQTNAGSYIVTAKFTTTGDYTSIPNMQAPLTIEKREIEIGFSGETNLVYNGNPQKTLSAFPQNLVEGDSVQITLSYSGDMMEQGEYIATATLLPHPNYKQTSPAQITVSITREEHTITFRQEGYADVIKRVLDMATLTDVPSPVQIDGYDVCWDRTDFSNVRQSDVVEAVLTPIEYAITYYLSGGAEVDNPTSYTVESDTIPLLSPTKSGYSFSGWFLEETYQNEITEITSGSLGDIELYAKWEIITFSIRYYLDDAENHQSNPATFTVQDLPFTLQNAYKVGHTFVGWFEGSDQTTPITQITNLNDYTLYPRFIEGSEGLSYQLVDGGYHITGYAGRDKHLCVPSTYQNLPVEGIGDSAFLGGTLQGITLTENILSIGESAFENCRNLTSITIPASVNFIGANAFSGCYLLIIYCESERPLPQWEEGWNYSCPVVWNSNENGVANDGYIYVVEGNFRYAIFGESVLLTLLTISESGEIIIPSSLVYDGHTYFVTSIDVHMSTDCSKVKSIAFAGTKEQWEGIFKELNWNTQFENITLSFTDESA